MSEDFIEVTVAVRGLHFNESAGMPSREAKAAYGPPPEDTDPHALVIYRRADDPIPNHSEMTEFRNLPKEVEIEWSAVAPGADDWDTPITLVFAEPLEDAPAESEF